MSHVVGPGGDNNGETTVSVDATTTNNKEEEEVVKPFKKKTRGTRGGKKNREKKLRAQGVINRPKSMRLDTNEEPKSIKFIRSKPDENNIIATTITTPRPIISIKRTNTANVIGYTPFEIIQLRAMPLSQQRPSHIAKIDRESKSVPPVEIYPVVYLPEDNVSPRKGELTEQKLIDKIGAICDEILDREIAKQYRVHGIEPHWANSRFKNKNEPRTNSSCSSTISTPRGQSSDSGCPSSNMTTPREVEEKEEMNEKVIKEEMTIIDAVNNKQQKEEKEECELTTTTTINATTTTTAAPIKSNKHPMRPMKNASQYHPKQQPQSHHHHHYHTKFATMQQHHDHHESPYVYGMPYTWYDQPMLVPMPFDPRYYASNGGATATNHSKRTTSPMYMPVYMPYSSPPLVSHSPSPVMSRRSSST